MNLHDYIASCGEKPGRWAKRNSIPKDRVYRVLAGKRISYDSAISISQASCGEVEVSELMNHGDSIDRNTQA